MANHNTWELIHRLAVYCVDDVTTDAYLVLIDQIFKQLPDDECRCRTHAQEYVREHPINELRGYTDDRGRPIGVFFWSWRFHNKVNRDLGKRLVPWPEAFSAYYGTQCESVCSRPH